MDTKRVSPFDKCTCKYPQRDIRSLGWCKCGKRITSVLGFEGNKADGKRVQRVEGR